MTQFKWVPYWGFDFFFLTEFFSIFKGGSMKSKKRLKFFNRL